MRKRIEHVRVGARFRDSRGKLGWIVRHANNVTHVEHDDGHQTYYANCASVEVEDAEGVAGRVSDSTDGR